MQIASSPFSSTALSGRSASAAQQSLSGTIYGSIDQMTQAIVQAGQRYTESYAARFAADESKTLTTDQMVAMLKEEFPAYTLVSSEPSDVVKGKSLLYIDDNNLAKMASDPTYRAKVMGLMRRELESPTVQIRSPDGTGTTQIQMTGMVFSLSDKNPSVDGIPYAGSATSVGFTTTTSGSGSARTSSRDSVRDWLEQALERAREARRTEAARQAAAAETASSRLDLLA
ncbi:hypothetical protein [Magnetospirillum fulvum]|uniref:Uncharacterized protein n=1 Tax=Magnetospirillum fulvum TaxID=1082 RepID=A0A1H6HEN7_MAGFU|nr:hypothetical protein [Magnetospirillum fulvum]SEH32403.1 hypothetical protein SAMN04244559_01238 [Magnetospirillum fulvum]